MNDSSNICLSCGLCCDGTLIGFVELEPEELPALKEIMEIEDVNGKGFFLHPCSKFCDGCTIYSKRPKQCDKFNCQLLNSVNQKELDFDLAVDVINVVKERKLAIEKKLETLPSELQSQSFYFKMIELKKQLQKKNTHSGLSQNDLELLSDLDQLNIILSNKFGLTL